MVRPNVLAILRFTTKSKRVGLFYWQVLGSGTPQDFAWRPL
jgi:hypothetical protein